MIYFLEDDPSIRKLVIYTLNSQGMEAEGFELPSQFWAAMERQLPSLVLLDLMLPEEDGLHILKRIRAGASTARLPVILITAKGTEYDKVVGLDGGADDYIAKPFGMMELMARIRTALRHSGGEAEPVHALTLGPLRIDPARHQVLAHGREVTLTLKEFQLLSLLVEHAGTVFTRDQLLNTIWGYEFDGASRTVDVHIRTLRQKLGEAGRCIETVRGVGYKAESDPSKSEDQPNLPQLLSGGRCGVLSLYRSVHGRAVPVFWQPAADPAGVGGRPGCPWGGDGQHGLSGRPLLRQPYHLDRRRRHCPL